MQAIIVLGMHRSGSSLTTSIIQKLGVHIGSKLLGTHPSQPKGHFEDVDFYELNMAILKSAGGNWASPPSENRILEQRARFSNRIASLIEQKSKRTTFCWKDPRTCLTLPLYLPYLDNPQFVLVYRKTSDIVGSLLKRSGGTPEKWKRLTRIYQGSMEKASMPYPSISVLFERLTTRNAARKEIELLNLFIGGNGHIEKALGLIDFRQ